MDVKKYSAKKYYFFCFIFIFFLGTLAACATNNSTVAATAKDTKPEKTASDPDSSPAGQEEIKEKISLNDIEVIQKTDGCKIVLSSNAAPQYTVFKLSNPHRLIVDLLDMESCKIQSPMLIDNNIIDAINSTTMEDKEHSFLRIEVGLKKDCMYTAERRDTAVFIDVTAEDTLESAQSVTETKKAPPIQPKIPNAAEFRHINDVSVLDNDRQSVITIISNVKIDSYNDFVMHNPARLVIDIPKSQKLFSQSVFRSQHKKIKEIRTGEKDDIVRFVVEFKEKDIPDYHIDSQDNSLNIAIPAPHSSGVTKTAESYKKKPETTDDPREQTEKTADASEKTAPEPTISLNLKDAQIKNVLRLLADLSGKNMIISDSVSGLVTLKLDNIAWNEALDIILDTHGLGKIESKNITRIETRENIRRINEEKLMAQKSQEEVEEMVIRTYDISYVDAEELENYIDDLDVLSKRGSVTSYAENNKLTVQDIVSNIPKVTRIVQEQDIATDQVMIEARIVQSVPSYTKELGIRWGGTYDTTHDGDPININGGAGNNYLVNLPAAAGEGAGGAINFGYIKENLNLDVQLSALENEDKIKIISNPRILGLDNQMARIKQGVALPYLKLSEEGVTSTEFKDAVLELEVTPKITLEDTIRLEVFVTKNQKSAQTGAGNEPGIDVREVETSLLVDSGNTVVIGGIYETTNSVNIKKVPFFGDLPYLGNLFKSKKEEDQLVELLVFLTVTVLEQPKRKTLASETSNNASLKN